MAAGDSKSLSSGISIPQWMKNKITDTRLDFDESTFSPPENDDSFLYIRYPQVSQKIKSPIAQKNGSLSTKVLEKLEVANHTAPCKQYISTAGYSATAVAPKSADGKIKSNGTDDGFKGEGAACGSSVVRVAHQMVSGRYPINTTTSFDDDPLKPKGFDPMRRRGSKSLPVTPISSPQSSPKSRRKLVNKYFTGPFVDSENHTGGWILQGLLNKRELSQSIGLIAEEGSSKSDIEKSISDLHLNDHKIEKKIKKEFKARPSELREMNFWSPTSM